MEARLGFLVPLAAGILIIVVRERAAQTAARMMNDVFHLRLSERLYSVPYLVVGCFMIAGGILGLFGILPLRP
jgi:hypothetical protein